MLVACFVCTLETARAAKASGAAGAANREQTTPGGAGSTTRFLLRSRRDLAAHAPSACAPARREHDKAPERGIPKQAGGAVPLRALLLITDVATDARFTGAGKLGAALPEGNLSDRATSTPLPPLPLHFLPSPPPVPASLPSQLPPSSVAIPRSHSLSMCLPGSSVSRGDLIVATASFFLLFIIIDGGLMAGNFVTATGGTRLSEFV